MKNCPKCKGKCCWHTYDAATQEVKQHTCPRCKGEGKVAS